MAFYQHASFPLCTFHGLPRKSSMSFAPFSNCFRVLRPVQSMASTKSTEQTIVRRSANYQPPIWDYDYVQSLRSQYKGEAYNRRANKLKEDVRILMLNKVEDPLYQLELIDNLQRLGLASHFEDEVKRLLKSIYNDSHRYTDAMWRKNNLYATALEFRLLRQHGYSVPQDVFNSFKDKNGNFKESLCDDTKGMLYIYEASYLLIEFENILEDARVFTTKHLEEYVKQNKDTYLSILVSHALEVPLHWRMIRSEARWFIDIYERKNDMNPILLELAKLDFNMVQATHQEDLRYVSKWWRNIGLGEKLSFARNRLMENFLWTVGVILEPQFGYSRRMLTKVAALITTIDDVYDVYGSLDELEWADLCKSYLLELKWYYSKYSPTLQEYIDNAWISVSAPVVLVHTYSFVSNPITKEALQCLVEYPNIVRWSSMILRFADDLGTSSDELKRGDVPKSIQCYMHETGASEEDAREHIRYLISKTWKKMNADCVANSPFTQTFIGIAMNVARMAQFMYQHGDGHSAQGQETKDRVLSLLIQPITLTYEDQMIK